MKQKKWTKKRRALLKSKFGTVINYFLCVFFFLVSVKGIYWVSTESWWGYHSQSWPHTQGVVISTDFDASYNKGTKMYAPQVVYKYTVKSKAYTNDVYSFPPGRDSSWDQINGEMAAYVPGGQVQIFYDPSNPQISCLVPGYSVWFTLFFAPVAIAPVAIAIGAFSLWMLSTSIRQERSAKIARSPG